MNFACEITYPVGESISGSIMASTPQLLSIGLTFLCDHFINHNNKKWISNVILLILIALSIIFVFLLLKASLKFLLLHHKKTLKIKLQILLIV